MLTDAEARKAKPTDKPYKLADSGGLYLYVAPSGLRSWRMKFRFEGKEKLLTFGAYPEMPLSAARDLRDEARQKLRQGADPSGARRRVIEERAQAEDERRRQQTFEEVARQWYETQSPRWVPVHASDVITSLERDVFPDLGDLPLSGINGPAILRTLRKVEERGSIETARRLRQRVSAVFAYALSEELVDDNPAERITKALKPIVRKGRQPALTKIEDLRKVLRAAEASEAQPVTKLASRLLSLTAVRPGVVRGAEWTEFEGIDWDDQRYGPDLAIWRVPAARMKLVQERKQDEAFEHIVPLSWQAVDALRAVRRLTGRGRLVFPGERHLHRPLSENAIGYLYNRVGFHGRHVPHGWRAAFSTIMNARAVKAKRADDKPIIELMLAHMPENKVAAAYDRASHMERRRELAQDWATLLLDGLPHAGAVLDGRRR